MPNNPVPNNEENQPDFEQLGDLFDESLPEAGGSALSDDDPLGSLGSLDLDPLAADSGLDPLSEAGTGFAEDATDQDDEPSGKKSKKGKKAKKKKIKAKKEKVPKEKRESAGLLQSLRETSPYTVMLGLTFLAIVIGVLCLLDELIDYGGDIGAEAYKQHTRLDPGAHVDTHVQLGPAMTAAVACPLQVRLTNSEGVAIKAPIGTFTRQVTSRLAFADRFKASGHDAPTKKTSRHSAARSTERKLVEVDRV